MTEPLPTRKTIALLTALTCSIVGPLSGSATTTPQAGPFVAETARFELRSAPRIALHHFLLAWAADDAGEWPRYALPLAERDNWRSVLDEQEQREWSAAVEAYATTVGRSLLFDEGLLAARAWAAGALPHADIDAADRPLTEALESVLPIFVHHWWPTHDARNRAWIESISPTLGRVEENMAVRFEAAYGGRWPATAIPVDVMVYANAVGAYSSDGRLTISSDPLGNQMPQGLEMIFHEASHTDPLEQPLRAGLGAAFLAAGGTEPDRFWHDVIFFTSGEITRLALAAQGEPGYQHYGTLGVYRRGERWARQLPALEEHWRPFLESGSQDAAARNRALEALAAQLLAGDD